MVGLEECIPDEKQRYKTIVEECVYFSDINSLNISWCKLLIDPRDEYNLHYHVGNTLDMDIHTDFSEISECSGFDAVIGNPPYHSSAGIGTGNTIWQHFTKASLQKWLRVGGYLLSVHPPGWRKPSTARGRFYKMYELMTSSAQMLHLSIHGINDGKQMFACKTRYDWYLIEAVPVYKSTVVQDEKGEVVLVDMPQLQWLPNYNIDTIRDMLATTTDDACELLHSTSAYEPRQKWMSSTKTDEYRYPCVHSTPKKGPIYQYSRVNDRGHFGVAKVIFGDSGITDPIVDGAGEYGMTHHAMALTIANEAEGVLLARSLQHVDLFSVIDSCSYSLYSMDWNMFRYFKKDFWRKYV